MVGKTASCTGVALVLCAALTMPAPAVALDPGINYDPGSPSGKEYAIPLVEGRTEGAGTTNQRRGANIPFGLGINPPGSGSGRTGGGTSDSSGRQGGSARGHRGGAGSGGNQRSRIEDAENVGGTGGRTLLIALAVLIPAALLAVLLQPRRPVSGGGRAG